jgi:hypothetical protein
LLVPRFAAELRFGEREVAELLDPLRSGGELELAAAEIADSHLHDFGGLRNVAQYVIHN